MDSTPAKRAPRVVPPEPLHASTATSARWDAASRPSGATAARVDPRELGDARGRAIDAGAGRRATARALPRAIGGPKAEDDDTTRARRLAANATTRTPTRDNVAKHSIARVRGRTERAPKVCARECGDRRVIREDDVT